jgi:hypothetical protein
MRLAIALLALLIAVPAYAQDEPEPMEPAALDSKAPWIELGIFGFGARVGVDLEGEGQLVTSATLDVGYLIVPQLRMRLSADIGVFSGDNTYVGSYEFIYRFAPDTAIAIPYVGTGLGLFGEDNCGLDPDCPAVWVQFVLGFEMRLREGMNWLIEYHPMDAFRRQRLMIGLTTRRGR